MSFFMPEQKTETTQENSRSSGNRDGVADIAKNDEQSEYLTVTTKSKSTRNSTIVLAVLFIIGLISLFVGIKKISINSASASTPDSEDMQLEIAIATITGIKTEMCNQMDEIVKKFFEFSDVRQIQVNELSQNPFRHRISLGETANTNQLDITGTIEEQQLKQIAKSMQLLSIMQSTYSPDQTCCMIDDKILYKGDSIKGFKVSEITENSVKLKSGTIEIELKLLK